MFNYSAMSTRSIFTAFEEEVLFDKDQMEKRRLLHPFILPTERHFISPFINHPEDQKHFEAASPDQYGFENTFCLVSQKMDSDLNKFLIASEKAAKQGYVLPVEHRLLMCRIVLLIASTNLNIFAYIDYSEKV